MMDTIGHKTLLLPSSNFQALSVSMNGGAPCPTAKARNCGHFGFAMKAVAIGLDMTVNMSMLSQLGFPKRSGLC
jgi:hypothetical protein